MCPRCREDLIIVEFRGIEVDLCLSCKGTWFDAGELELVAELAGTRPGRLESVLRAAGGESGKLRCPRCRGKMIVSVIGGGQPIEIDRCPQGEGIWLDAGELAAVVRELGGRRGEAAAEFFGDLFRYELAETTETEGKTLPGRKAASDLANGG